MRKLWDNLFSKDSMQTEIELHVAGATVRHKNPFEDLNVARNLEELDTIFIEKWVVSFYMNGFSNFSEDVEKKFVDIYPQINFEIITKLLGDFNWRTRIVGAYFAALKNLVDFEEIIGTHLLKSEVCYAGSGYCLALASFGTEKSKDFLKRYLDYYLTRKDLWFDQSDALSALFWMDEKEAEKYDLLWNDFAADKSNWNLETSKENFAKSMQNLERIKNLSSKIKAE
jgi:Family of unknown function (DUF6000)